MGTSPAAWVLSFSLSLTHTHYFQACVFSTISLPPPGLLAQEEKGESP